MATALTSGTWQQPAAATREHRRRQARPQPRSRAGHVHGSSPAPHLILRRLTPVGRRRSGCRPASETRCAGWQGFNWLKNLELTNICWCWMNSGEREVARWYLRQELKS